MPTVYPKNILGTGQSGVNILGTSGNGFGVDVNAWHVVYTLPPFPGFHEVVSITSEGIYWLELTGWLRCGSFLDRVQICCLVSRNSIERVGLNHESDVLLISIQDGIAKVLVPQQTTAVTYSLRVAYRYLTKPRAVVTFGILAGREVVPIA